MNDAPASRLSLSDPARVAELTGLTVVDDFPARDLARGGRGGPIDALAQWIILRDATRCRALVDLERTIRLIYLPPARWVQAAERVTALDVGPGMDLLDRLAFRLTNGKHRFDPGGTLAVQGRQIPELLQSLLSADCFHRPAPYWQPQGVSADWFLDESIQSALAAGWSMRDLLCTATHLIAESIARSISQRVPHTPPVAELILTGGGRQNGFLLREITRRLPQTPCTRLEELSIDPDHLDAASTAVLTLLHLDQVPQTHTLITGAVTPRVLGRLTPGAPKHWRLVLSQIAQHSHARMALRQAV
jgi:anhydro-N-acetylmuramic acid kinase